MSLRRRFVLVIALFAVGLAALFWFLSWRISSDALEREMETRLIWTAGAAAETGLPVSSVELLRQPGDEFLAGSLQERLQRLLFYVRDAFVFRGDDFTFVVGAGPRGRQASGRVASRVGAPLPFLEPYRPEIQEALAGGQGTATDAFPGPDGRLYKFAFVQLEQSRFVLGVLARADYLGPLNRLRRTLIFASLAALAVAVLLGAFLAGNVARPLERLSRVALRIQRGHMEEPVAVAGSDDEVGKLSRAMERMREGILQRDERLRLMLAQVAHEIRNPLGGLELFASAAAETEDAAERRRLMGRMREEVTALNRIIDEFLTFARPVAAQPRAVDVRGPVREALDLAAPEVERDGDHLEVELADEPLVVRGDPDQIKRAVLNLVRNASQAGSRVRVRAERSGSQVLVAVSDDGPGVPEELREQVFEPFFTQKEKGAGLGLSIVRKVAEAQGGRVEVSPEPDPKLGEGAEFRLYLIGIEEPAVAALSERRSPLR